MKWPEAKAILQLKHQEPNFEKLINSAIIGVKSYRRLHEFLLIYHTNYRHHLHQYFNHHHPDSCNVRFNNTWKALLEFIITKQKYIQSSCNRRPSSSKIGHYNKQTKRRHLILNKKYFPKRRWIRASK